MDIEVEGRRAEDDDALAEHHMAIDGGKVFGRERCRHDADV